MAAVSTTRALARVDFWMRTKYRRPLATLKPTETPGYWEARELAAGEFPHTYSFFDPPRENGRFASITRSWELLRTAGAPF